MYGIPPVDHILPQNGMGLYGMDLFGFDPLAAPGLPGHAGGPGYMQAQVPSAMKIMMGQMMQSVTHLTGIVAQSNTQIAKLTAQVSAQAADGEGVQVEGTALQGACAHGSHSGAYAARGRRPAGRGGRAAVVVEVDVSMAKMELKLLSKTQRAARAAISLTGISRGSAWPAYNPAEARKNPDTEEPYFDVHFTSRTGVNDPVNVKLLQQVAEIVEEDVNMLVYEIAKETWANFKRKYNAQHDEEKKLAQEINNMNSRWQLRRKQMSDEASGPDRASGESKPDWRARMAGLLGMMDVTPEFIKTLPVFEVIRSNWQSDEYREMSKELREMYAESLTAKQAQTSKFRVRNLGRSSDTPPAVAPYNFGINMEWLDAHKDMDTYHALLHDWGTYEDPVGFGSSSGGANGDDGEQPDRNGAQLPGNGLGDEDEDEED
ncbi:uncharacterized protein TRAVEDRAFT_16968 [Trametes versicolor FP-101664 SS1]|uniref:uncharacterized protein n=1 Tax=Trametes versicolor (strain FP-101664) TaxID=717944 RepID=UPI0004621422|nr:uncharacterized protein TRAVEDRAFT_16968 [Trametes versicolor FP-101664 SS1]EIW65148.1 hypothetical protein TRAVEDRAFT_16968 [Trametes versicolor FP-101664 SS1]